MSQDSTKTSAAAADNAGTIQVAATYLAARKPANLKFPAVTPLSEVKAAILDAFKLEEGPTPDGQSQIVYHLYDGEAKLTDLSRTIGSVAEPGKHAKLNIVKQIIQG